jgi:hypothetical protein
MTYSMCWTTLTGSVIHHTVYDNNFPREIEDRRRELYPIQKESKYLATTHFANQKNNNKNVDTKFSAHDAFLE